MVPGKKVITDEYLKALTPLALAIWFMDEKIVSIPLGMKWRRQSSSTA